MSEEKISFLTKLDELEARYSQIEKQIAEPAIASDSAKLIKLSKEQGKLKDIVTKYREYKTTMAGIDDAGQILKDGTVDEDFRNLAKEENTSGHGRGRGGFVRT
jgi:peptide chain release factor 1